MKLVPLVMIVLAVYAFISMKLKSRPTYTPPAALELPENPETLIQSLRDSNWQVRKSAAQALADHNTPAIVNALANALQDSDNDVRETAAASLLKIGIASLPTLLTMLDSKTLEARILSAETLGKLNHADAVPGLLNALKDESMWVRVPAANSLGLIAHADAVPGLIEALEDKDKDVRKAVKKALKAIGTPEALDALQD